MAELTIDPKDIAAALRKHVDSFRPETEREEVGRVLEVGDGIARVHGLPSTMTNELLEFPHEIYGLAFNLEEDRIGCVLFTEEPERIQEGDPVKRTGRILSVPVGDGLLGRVVDPLGQPMDGRGPIRTEADRPLEVQAPSVVMRQPVKEPLYTGLKAIDAMTAIGRGQRQLIIGDRQVGKTAVAVDAIINQRDEWATGDPKKHRALEFTVVVNAPAGVPAPFKYIAPYAGSAIGQHWMYQGQHALIIFDDLSKQADAYREVSQLLRRPAGREAYPGDVFYLHSRLLERCAKLSDEEGGGSLTGLPIVETKGGDVSGYIPTNVISITDGQIYLETDLFFAGVRPAINVGISVSRVGGNAQIKAMKQVAGRLRLDLAQYRELEAFAEFGSELDKASQAQLERGARVVEILKQPQYRPMPVDKQIISIYAVTNGYLDDVSIDDAKRFEEELLRYVEARHADVARHFLDSGDLPDEIEAKLKEAVADFKRQFQPSEAGVPTTAGAAGGPVDRRRQDVGWDRVGEPEPGEDEAEPEREPMTEEEYEEEAGPVGDTDAQPPG
jgi:F-type H+-transporting ATPase subunit alpha